jgi:hypothetical protein
MPGKILLAVVEALSPHNRRSMWCCSYRHIAVSDFMFGVLVACPLQSRLTAIASQHAQDFLAAHSTSSGAKGGAGGKDGRKESEGPTSVLGKFVDDCISRIKPVASCCKGSVLAGARQC